MRPRDRGSGTVLALGLIAVALVLGLALAALASAQGARGRAQAAADLAALAAATALQRGWEACPTAQETAGRNGAVVVACDEQGDGVVRVDVTREARGWAGVLGTARAAARAGPASAR
ncbi:Rv3654c family TadE-like protein [Oerskovia sp. KBS0722]|uniref:Rv3654c family TadE-like protein n=1 Tax=Oerskovia sp. KBS0722 TaxID=1179673 RepID=UPI001FEF5E3A|nr:Rv3654c family TadE-like protein [Oerskovia sp. KBS0722]